MNIESTINPLPKMNKANPEVIFSNFELNFGNVKMRFLRSLDKVAIITKLITP